MKLNKFGKRAIFVLGGSVLLAFGLTACDSNKPLTEVQVAKIQEENRIKDEKREVYENIGSAHSVLNDLVCWQRYTYFDSDVTWENSADKLTEVTEYINIAYKNAKNNNLKKDLSNAVKLINKGVKEKDVDMLIYSHRILHDLDYFFNDHESPDVVTFGYTYYGKGKDVTEVEKSLK